MVALQLYATCGMGDQTRVASSSSSGDRITITHNNYSHHPTRWTSCVEFVATTRDGCETTRPAVLPAPRRRELESAVVDELPQHLAHERLGDVEANGLPEVIPVATDLATTCTDTTENHLLDRIRLRQHCHIRHGYLQLVKNPYTPQRIVGEDALLLLPDSLHC